MHAAGRADLERAGRMAARIVDQFSFEHEDQFESRMQVSWHPGARCVPQDGGGWSFVILPSVVQTSDVHVLATIGAVGLTCSV